MLKTFTTSDSTTTILWNGSLAKKIELLAREGIEYTPTAEELQAEADFEQFKDTYIAMITRLEQIQAASNPNNAQVLQAIKDEAMYIERIMKFLKRALD